MLLIIKNVKKIWLNNIQMQKQETTHKINSIKKNKSLFIVKIIKEV